MTIQEILLKYLHSDTIRVVLRSGRWTSYQHTGRLLDEKENFLVLDQGSGRIIFLNKKHVVSINGRYE